MAAGSLPTLSRTGQAAPRPIYMDNSLIGWMEDTANGQAKIVLNRYDKNRKVNARGGIR